MEYGMVSRLIPEEYDRIFRSNSKNNMQDAANALQWNLYHGLCTNLGKAIPLFNLLPCGSYPQYYKYPFISSFSFDRQGHNLAFCNVKLIRNYFITYALKKALNYWCQSNQEAKTLFVYTLSQPLLAAVCGIKKKYPDLQVCAIVADLPDMANLSSKKSKLLRLFSTRKAKESYAMLSCIDSFVLLTKQMADYMHITQPYCVMEGIASEVSTGALQPDGCWNHNQEDEQKIILYTGTLHRKFGVLHLLEAFRRIPDLHMRLILCGIGDSEEEIRLAAKEDSRIDFRGQLSRDEVIILQKQATVLVNPRLNNEEFTRYSFPSKTMEYLASGVPVIAYKLDGIPEEYDTYLIYPEDDSIEALAFAIEDICSKDVETRRSIGSAGRDYILNNKNPVSQTKRVLDFLENQ